MGLCRPAAGQLFFYETAEFAFQRLVFLFFLLLVCNHHIFLVFLPFSSSSFIIITFSSYSASSSSSSSFFIIITSSSYSSFSSFIIITSSSYSSSTLCLSDLVHFTFHLCSSPCRTFCTTFLLNNRSICLPTTKHKLRRDADILAYTKLDSNP